jgi:hypothetical protein
MALICVFLAVFAVAMLYSLIGTAEVVFFRERMQDAADSAALSSAIMHARTMNFIVLVNIVMAALLAILIALKLVEGLCIIGMVIAAALAWPSMGATLVAIPPLRMLQATIQTSYENLKPPIDTALEVLHTAADVVKTVAPAAAGAMVQADLAADWKLPVEAGFAAGAYTESGVEVLPIEDDSFSVLCKKGGELTGGIALAPVKPIIGGWTNELAGAVGEMTEALADWFCGGDGGGGTSTPPSFHRDQKQNFPRSEDMRICAEKNTPRECAAGQRFEEQGLPDKTTGECRPATDCSLDGFYEARLQLAREQCDPTVEPKPIVYWFQKLEGSVTYVWQRDSWQRGEPRYHGPPAAIPSDPGAEHLPWEALQPPCGPPSVRPTIAEGYNLAVRRTEDVKKVVPVCTTERAPIGAPGLKDPATRTVPFVEVRHILGCTKVIRVEVSVGEGSTASGGESRSPKKVISTARLGDANFQIRSLVKGNAGGGEAGHIVRLALWNRSEPENPLAPIRRFGNFAFAQAEYFYDGPNANDRGTWMWNMSWRARLTRFRMSEDIALASFTAACLQALGADASPADPAAPHVGPCDEALNMLSQMSAVITH